MECPICYENVNENGDMLWLECLHALCRRCLRKLERKTCPFCRTDISTEIGRVLNDAQDACHVRPYSAPIRVRARRQRRRRRTYVDMMDMDDPNLSLVIESFENISSKRASKKSKKNANRNERSRKGKWANSQGRVRGARVNKAR